MTPESDIAVLAEDLHKSFGSTKALDGVSFHVDRASVVGLLGPNGAGKTTAVRVLTTLVRPDSGRAFIDGIDVLADPTRAKSRIGLTGQYAAVDERLTGFENLQHVGRLYHLPMVTAKQRGRELLERFKLEDAADRVVKGYSGGMRRRLDVAMSLIARPSVLFLDEPTTGLDPRSRVDVWDLIEELVRGGTTTLLTTQYLDEADRLADEVVVVDHGSVIATGTPQLLKEQVGGDRIELTFPDPVDLGAVMEALRGRTCGEPTTTESGRRIVVPVHDVQGIVPAAVRQLDAAGIALTDVVVRESTLDDVFFALTGHAAEDAPDAPPTDQREEVNA
ncbi:MAG: ATP-binding cassette domain-containing protein [Ilumatobacteraceae bacterium]